MRTNDGEDEAFVYSTEWIFFMRSFKHEEAMIEYGLTPTMMTMRPGC